MGFFDFISDVPLVGDALGIVTGKSRSMQEQQMMASYDYSKQLDLMREQAGMQKDFADYQNQLQQETWNQQFTTQNQYNDPSKAVQRYLRAGITPSAAFGGSTVGQSSASIQASPVSGGSLPNAQPTRSMIDYANANNMQFATIAQALASIATAFKGTTEGVKAAATINEEVEGMQLDNKLKDIQLQADKAYKVPSAKAAYNKILEETHLLFQQAENAQLDGLVKLEERANKIQERLYTIAKTEEQRIVNNTLSEVIRQQIAESRSRVYFNYKHGDKAEQESRQVEYINNLWNDPEVKSSKLRELQELGNTASAKRELTESQKKEVDEAIENARNANDKWQFTYWFDKAMRLVDTSGKFIKNISK